MFSLCEYLLMPLVGEGWTQDGLYYRLYEVPGRNPPWKYHLQFINDEERWMEDWDVAVGVPGSVESVEELVRLLEERGSGVVRGVPGEEWIAYAKVRKAVMAKPWKTGRVKLPPKTRGLLRVVAPPRAEREERVRLKAPKVKVKYGLGRDEEKALKALFDDVWITVYGSARGEEYGRRRRQLEARIAEWKRRYRNVERDEAYALAEREMLEWMRGFLIP